MAVKRKISIRKILQVFTTFVAASACIVAISSASRIEGQKMLTGVEIHINSGKKYHFIEENQIKKETIEDRNIDIEHTPLGRLDIQSMERVLKADPWVADASLYVDARRVLHMSVTQRIPVVRLFEQGGASYYMDNTLNVMPLSANVIYYTSVVTNMPPLHNDSVSEGLKKQIVALVHNIQADTFWNAQISQIIVDSDYSFELVPVLGQQRIIFGDTSRMKEKFSNIYTFYLRVLNRIGWDKYETLDVRFKGQVVAAPSLPFKGPVDKAKDMNWINSIVQTEARMDSAHLVATEAKAQAKTEARVEAARQDDKKEVKKEVKKEEKKEPKKEVKKDPVKEVKKDQKHDARPADKKDIKKEVKKEVKKEPAKEVKKDDKKDAKHDAKPADKKDAKKEPKKEDKKEVKHDAPLAAPLKKKEEVKDNKQKPKYVLPENKNNQ